MKSEAVQMPLAALHLRAARNATKPIATFAITPGTTTNSGGALTTSPFKILDYLPTQTVTLHRP